MRLQNLTERIAVPANASRFLSTREVAQSQPMATVQLAWRIEDPYVFNSRFDPGRIEHDSSYCTSVVDIDEIVQVPTASYFVSRVLPHGGSAPRVLDIGCGQGEFVTALRCEGVDAVGFDPVLRHESSHLHARYWTPTEARADIFVMRCVLPHIPDPWRFLDEIATSNPSAMVLIEYQRLEWILESRIWYQISHDHVNLFSAEDFSARFPVIDQGTFSNGEWAWVLLRASDRRPAEPRECRIGPSLRDLLELRHRTLDAAARSDRPLALWGAAGKGIVLGHALQASGAPVVAAIDADPLRQGLFMEVSGIPILSPSDALKQLSTDTRILVCNPNHLPQIRARISESWDLLSPSDLVTTD